MLVYSTICSSLLLSVFWLLYVPLMEKGAGIKFVPLVSSFWAVNNMFLSHVTRIRLYYVIQLSHTLFSGYPSVGTVAEKETSRHGTCHYSILVEI